MRNQYLPCMIFSVYKSDKPLVLNQHNTKLVEHELKRLGYSYEKVLGVYQGNEEISCIVTGINLKVVSKVLSLAKGFEQDSILLRDNENTCHLKFFDGREPLKIGKMNEVSVETAMESDAYTYSPRLKRYFVCQ